MHGEGRSLSSIQNMQVSSTSFGHRRHYSGADGTPALKGKQPIKGSFACTVSVTVNLFDVMCKQHNRAALNPFLNGTKKWRR